MWKSTDVEENKIEYVYYDKTCANPTTKSVQDAFDLYGQNQCDLIIVFGGGSSMDCAKALGARVARPKKSLAQMKGILKIHKKLAKLAEEAGLKQRLAETMGKASQDMTREDLARGFILESDMLPPLKSWILKWGLPVQWLF